MIVATLNNGGCTCHVDDSAYKDKSPEDVEQIIQQFSEFMAACLLKRKTA